MLLLQNIQILFPEPLSGGSQLPVIIAPKDLASPFGICRQFMQSCVYRQAFTHRYTWRRKLLFLKTENMDSLHQSLVMRLRSKFIHSKYMSYSTKIYIYDFLYIIYMHMYIDTHKERCISFHVSVNIGPTNSIIEQHEVCI